MATTPSVLNVVNLAGGEDMYRALVEVQGVSKHYRLGGVTVKALDDVSFTIRQGEFVAIMGPSGSGKTSLLLLIGGLDRPSQGYIRVGDTRLDELDEVGLSRFRLTHVGFVFQSFNLIPTLSAVENVALPLLIAGRPRREALARAASLLDRLGLAHRRHHTPDALSGGEMQRVAIARALAMEPMLILADEPTGNLDLAARDEVLHLLRQLCQQEGRTILMVTHDAEAAAYADRTILLRGGRLEREGVHHGAAPGTP